MKKLYYLLILTVILGLVLTGCLLSNVGQVPTSEQSGIAYLTKNGSPPVLVGLWHFDGDATDSSGNGNHGILQGDAGFDTGMFGQALSVDGAGDYVDVGDIGVTGDWTVEFWANLGSASATIYYPIGLSLGSPNGKGIFVGGTYAPTAGKWGVYDGTNWILGSDVYTDTWYHFAVTKSGTTYTLYRGAAYENSGALTDIDISDLDIGRRSEGVWYFDGLIDEVRIWSSALTANQIQQSMASPLPVIVNTSRLGHDIVNVNTVEYWDITITVCNYDALNNPTDVVVQGGIGADLVVTEVNDEAVDPPLLTKGDTAIFNGIVLTKKGGKMGATIVRWDVGTLSVGECLPLDLEVKTGLNPKDKQEFTSAEDDHELDGGFSATYWYGGMEYETPETEPLTVDVVLPTP